MKQILQSKGWVMYHDCNCGGSRKEYYSNTLHPGFDIVIRPTKNVAWILEKNHLIEGKFWGYQLADKMSKNNL